MLCIGRASVPPGALYDGTLRIKHKGDGINQTSAPPQLIVVQHWTEELKRLVPTK